MTNTWPAFWRATGLNQIWSSRRIWKLMRQQRRKPVTLIIITIVLITSSCIRSRPAITTRRHPWILIICKTWGPMPWPPHPHPDPEVVAMAGTAPTDSSTIVELWTGCYSIINKTKSDTKPKQYHRLYSHNLVAKQKLYVSYLLFLHTTSYQLHSNLLFHNSNGDSLKYLPRTPTQLSKELCVRAPFLVDIFWL